MSVRLMLVLFSMIATTVMGMLVTGVLAYGRAGSREILIAAAVGFVLAIPISWAVARGITAKTAA
ncbi:hypothetical protein GTZ99_14495 [Novosphingobium sp. FSY-8]|uniref:CTP synthetase n=1 Tax=Novosphingobium ovatum TaxID=1908523 RepID=A0ABW9XGS9_9SPHN|nr:hypothetical protein [Novosphingobium ovatum]NBC37761.1 hypothetical protein [Novosphingobium ovatum]